MTSLAEKLIGEEEGRRHGAYRDSRGYLTIGIGCLIDPSVPGSGLCDAAIDAQFDHDILSAKLLAQNLPSWDKTNDVQKASLISMCFQLPKIVTWPHFKDAMAAGDFKAAAMAARDSDWWRVQTHNRAERECQMLETGVWVERITR